MRTRFSLDPNSRAQLGAHSTGGADIERVVEPVLMPPSTAARRSENEPK